MVNTMTNTRICTKTVVTSKIDLYAKNDVADQVITRLCCVNKNNKTNNLTTQIPFIAIPCPPMLK